MLRDKVRSCENRKALNVESLPFNVARRLSPRLAKPCHEKLVDPAKNHVTNFQLKPAKKSEILLKKLLFLRCLKKLVKLCINFWSCTHYQWTRQ